MAKKKTAPKTESKVLPVDDAALERLQSSILDLRGERVILDSDLAEVYGVETKRLNEQVRRNAAKFGEKYVFQLNKEEHESLRSQSATSKSGRGGRRYPPWVFTEYGVVMAATVLDSEKAIEASKFVVDVFVEVKRKLSTTESTPAGSVSTALSPLERLSNIGEGIGARLQTALVHVLDSVVDAQKQSTVREEWSMTVSTTSLTY